MRKMLALVLAMCMLAACAPAHADMLFAWWGGEDRHEATIHAVEAYMAMNPDEYIDVAYGPWTGWEEKFAQALRDGAAADINQVNCSWLSHYASMNAFIDLNDYADLIDL